MPLRVVVVALGGPVAEGQVTTRSAVQLARASAMYADQVLLISPWADIAGRLHGFKESSDSLKRLWETIATDPRARELLADGPATAQFLQDAGEILSTDHPVNADAAELARAGEGGLLDHRSLMGDRERPLIERLLDQLVPLLADADVHAVFDHRAQTIIGAHLAQKPGVIGEAAGTRHREAELGAGLIARLPAFPQIPLDEVKDIKAELHGPLARYRSKVAALQADMKQDIASPETDAEIVHEWRRSVAPALAELRESMIDHSFTRELARVAASSARDLVISGASLSLGLSALTNVATALTAAAAPTGMALQATAQAVLARAKARSELRKSDYYYLFQLQRAGERSRRNGKVGE